mmetsp:Transcript_6036/g.14326  ORF Transcript_6036/g.14326 Transcript_6036/m.14326 type:complete len:112 (-) Transcript_6036:8-343(-)
MDSKADEGQASKRKRREEDLHRQACYSRCLFGVEQSANRSHCGERNQDDIGENHQACPEPQRAATAELICWQTAVHGRHEKGVEDATSRQGHAEAPQGGPYVSVSNSSEDS